MFAGGEFINYLVGFDLMLVSFGFDVIFNDALAGNFDIFIVGVILSCMVENQVK